MARALLILSLLALTACSARGQAIYQTGKAFSAEAAAETIDAYCAFEGPAIERRKVRVKAVNMRTERGDLTPLDCNQDGKPDF